MTRKLFATLVLSLGAVMITYLFSTSHAVLAGQAGKKNVEGRKLFMQHCATCHGLEAKGDGPTAKVLKKAPADLTKIEKVNGKFPFVHVQRIISGDDLLESHGSRDMPVWGTFLRRKVGPGFAQMEIYNLTKFVE